MTLRILGFFMNRTMRVIGTVVAMLIITCECGFAQANFWEQTNGPYGPGHVNSMHSGNDGRLWVCSGGVLYRSSDMGTSFSGIYGGISGSVHILIDSHKHVFVTARYAIFRSSDDGNSWTQVLWTSPNMITSFALDSSAYIFAGTSDGLLRSSDDGITWLRLEMGQPSSHVRSLGVNSQGHIFVSVGSETGNDAYPAIRSTDHGTTWNSLAMPATAISGFAFAPGGYIVASFYQTDGAVTDSAGVLSSSDSGQSWSKHHNITHKLSSYSGIPLIFDEPTGAFIAAASEILRSVDFGRTWKTLAQISVSDLSSDQRGNLYARTSGGLTRSTDGGATWMQCSDSGFFAANLRFMTLMPDGRIYVVADEGVSRLANDRASWVKESALAGRSVLLSNAGNYFLSSNLVYKSTDRGTTWTTASIYIPYYLSMFAGELTKLSNGYIFAAVNTNTTFGGGTGQTSIWRSTNEGASWDSVYKGTIGGGGVQTMTAVGNEVVLAGGDLGILRSTDGGTNWSRVGYEFGTVTVLRARADGAIFAGSDGHRVFRSTDKGLTWSAVNSGLPFPLSVRAIAFNSAGTVFVGASESGVFRSTDNGDHWSNKSSGLLDRYVSSLLCDSADVLYAATQYGGVYRSRGPTTSVQYYQADLPHAEMLSPNYPNPFNPSTTIGYSLSKTAVVSLRIFNTLGQLVATLVDAKEEVGYHQVQWSPSNVPSGIYFYRLLAGDASTGRARGFVETKKMILLR